MKDKKNTKISDFVSKVEDGTNEAFDRVIDPLMDEDAAEANTSNIGYTDIVKITPEEKMKKLPWIVAIVLIILIVLSFCTLFFQSNPKTIFVKAIDGLFNGITRRIGDSAYDVVNGNLDLEYVVHSDIDNSNLDDELSKIKWKAKYSLDVTNDRAYASISGNNGEDELKFDIYNDKKENYIKFDNSADYLKIGDGHFSLKSLNSFDDFNTLLEGVNQAFDKAIASEKITGGNKTVNLNGKEVKVYESKLVIDGKNKKRFKEAFINSMSSNTSFIKSLHNIRNTDIKDDILNMQTSKDKLSKVIDEAGNIEISLYTKGKNHDFVEMIIKMDNGEFNLVKKEKDFSYSLTKDDEKIEGIIIINSKNNKHNINLSLEKKENGKTLFTQNIKLDLKTKDNGSFKNIDTGNFIEYASMSDVDKFNLQTNIVSNPVIAKLVSSGLEVNLDEWFK